MADTPAYDPDTNLPIYGNDDKPMLGCCCDGGYLQAFKCEDDSAINLWATATSVNTDKIYSARSGGGTTICVYFDGEPQPTPGTQDGYEIVREFDDCAVCLCVSTCCDTVIVTISGFTGICAVANGSYTLPGCVADLGGGLHSGGFGVDETADNGNVAEDGDVIAAIDGSVRGGTDYSFNFRKFVDVEGPISCDVSGADPAWNSEDDGIFKCPFGTFTSTGTTPTATVTVTIAPGAGCEEDI